MKDFIPYEVALALKELGFDETSLAYYNDEKKLIITSDPNFKSSFVFDNSNPILAPLYQQAFRWFREKGFHCAIMPKITPSNSVVYYMYEGKPKKNWDNCFETYEEAELACLNKLIEIVKTK
jgi:hypothetical protein